MIDHVSIPVSDLAASAAFYERVLEPLGMIRFADREETAGFGRKYPEFWLNLRPKPESAEGRALWSSGLHVRLRTPDEAAIAFHERAVALAGGSDGAPGARRATPAPYFAAFIRDLDGNRIEATTFSKAP